MCAPEPDFQNVSRGYASTCPSVLTSNCKLYGEWGLYGDARPQCRTNSAGTTCFSCHFPSRSSKYPNRSISVARTATPPPPGVCVTWREFLYPYVNGPNPSGAAIRRRTYSSSSIPLTCRTIIDARCADDVAYEYPAPG